MAESAVRVAVAIVLVVSIVGKMRNPSPTIATLRRLGYSESSVIPMLAGVVAAESLVAVLLLAASGLVAGAALAVLFVVFAVVSMRIASVGGDCGCFGGQRTTRRRWRQSKRWVVAPRFVGLGIGLLLAGLGDAAPVRFETLGWMPVPLIVIGAAFAVNWRARSSVEPVAYRVTSPGLSRRDALRRVAWTTAAIAGLPLLKRAGVIEYVTGAPAGAAPSVSPCGVLPSPECICVVGLDGQSQVACPELPAAYPASPPYKCVIRRANCGACCLFFSNPVACLGCCNICEARCYSGVKECDTGNCYDCWRNVL